ncbi:MAG: fatty acid--CoA ligase [Desulfosalsimonadaceae bacterium]
MTFRKVQSTPSAYNYQLLIKHILETPLIYFPEREIIYRDLKRYTYRDLNRRIHQLANMLSDQGAGPGSTVAVMDWDSHRYLECFFAVPMMGAVLHTVNVRLSPEQLIYTINHAEDDIILVNEDFLPLLEAVKDKFETVKKIILLNDSGKTPDTSLRIDGEYEGLVEGAAKSYDFPDFEEDTMATTFYTTGTTGMPKGVYFSHRQLVMHTYGMLTNLAAYEGQCQITSGDVYMPMTPMFHVHAWGVPYVMTLLGAKQVYPGRYEPEMLLKLLTREKVTFSHCVPTIMHMLVSSPAIKQFNLSGWKVIIGGAALPRGLCEAALQLGINIFAAYGMSETCPLLTMALLRPEMMEWEEKEQVKIRCRTGRPSPFVYLRIFDPEGNALPHDGKSTGEVVVRCPWLTQGYLKDPEKSEELWQGGWLHTGDIGYVDEYGYLQITDRLKDVIKSGGEWISSLTLEDIISQHEAVSEAAAIGVPDDKWGERPLVLVVLKEDYKGKVEEEEFREFFRKFVDSGDIPKYGVPNQVQVVDEIPKTSVGKINKKDLRSKLSG